MHAISARWLGLAAVVMAIAACAAESGDKSGARTEPRVTLTLQMPDRGDPLGQAFAAAVTKRSGGSVRIEFGTGYDNSEQVNEFRLARALQSGDADLGYLPARAWATAGVPAFQALLAPFGLTTLDAQEAVASGPVGDQVLDALPGEVVGLALVPGELRRVVATRPLRSPADFAGLRLNVFDDPESAAAFRALGAIPVQRLPRGAFDGEMRARRLDGAESTPGYILVNSFWNHARHLTSYGVFPRFESIVVNRAAWRRLSSAQQRALRDAAGEVVRAAAGVVADQERSHLRQLCAAGVRVATPTDRQLAQFAAVSRPIVARFETDPTAGRVLAATRALPSSGPRALAAPLPEECSNSGPSAEQTTFPEGVYVTKVTAEQFRAAGALGPQAQKDVTYTTRFRGGKWTETQTPTYPDQCADVPTPDHGPCAGTYRVAGDRITLTWTPPTPPPIPAPETLRWSYFDGTLRFEVIDVADPGSVAIYEQPWRKVG